MRKFIAILLAFIPIVGMSQAKNVISTNRVFPKVDKVLEFEKALAAHAQKYHTGDWKWRIFEIQSGPDAGGYHITEGPSNWTGFDTRGNLGTAHNNDWNRSVAIYLTDRGSAGYSIYEDSLSSVGLTQFTEKIIINHVYPKPGMIIPLRALVMKMKKVWADGGESMAVYSAVSSGEPQLTQVNRLTAGLKELEDGYRKPFSERYNMMYGPNAWNTYLDEYSRCVERRWSELLFLRADLSSKL
jgi:hypothetical protein